MCKWGTNKSVYLKIPADLSSTGKVKWRWMKIDACIADLVKTLQQGGVDMRGSCCGHFKSIGDIHLQDGRVLLVLSGHYADEYYRSSREILYLKLFYRQLLWDLRWLLRYVGQYLKGKLRKKKKELM